MNTKEKNELIEIIRERLWVDVDERTKKAESLMTTIYKFRRTYFDNSWLRRRQDNWDMSEMKNIDNSDLRIILQKCYKISHEFERLKKENIDLLAENRELSYIKEKIENFNK